MIKKLHSSIWFTALVGICVILACGCVNEDTPVTPDSGAVEPTVTEPPIVEPTGEETLKTDVQPLDYTEDYNWLTIPSIDKSVDVFYVYPTVSSNTTGVMDITSDDERALAGATYQGQATVFEQDANVFAPYYRQMTTGVDLSGYDLATDTPEFKQGAVDVQDAFEYYLDNLNRGRPFIIAGHSQGSMALIELIKNRFGDDEVLRNRMVAAYLIGYTVTDADLEKAGLRAAERADDTGVVVTYNTQSPTSAGGAMLLDGANCINPLNWKTDDTYAPKSENLGAVFYDDTTGEFLSEELNYCDAQINLTTGALITVLPEDNDLNFGNQPEGVYHRQDYGLYYRNLEQNVGDRIKAYFEQ
ncbi:DUF3089 domain-containing protein [Methanogenium marinum]|uniref:DUF3089 domain-containing protein n=1 Tax=Methanogenium marinum TaxID=348610 RepID=A0A9Q4KVH9_9EURY|nr:DUF3089 domain-containing protein [Methanogenium marinum]MDE4908241.1 DUF3089 domain-containing protein [Methanogenium marinum]